MKRQLFPALAAILVAGLLLAGCAPAAPPQPTAAPAKPAAAPTAAPAAPTAAPKAAEPTKAAAPAQPTAAPAAKVAWPEKGKTITGMIGYAAGGPNDLMSRIMTPGMEKVLGVTIQIVNKAGASSLIALSDVAKAKPDGYTIGGLGMPTVAIAMADPETKSPVQRKDVIPVANFESHASILVVHPDSPYKTMKDVMDAAKAKPRGIKFSAIGQLGTGALIGYYLQEAAGVQFSFVYFDSGAEAQTAVMGGHADITSVNPIVAVPAVKSGQLRALASTGTVPSKVLPDVKTLKAQGYDVVNVTAQGWAAPAGTPKEIVDILANSVKQAMEMDDIKKKLEEQGNEVLYLDPAKFSAFWDEQDAIAKKGIAAARAQR